MFSVIGPDFGRSRMAKETKRAGRAGISPGLKHADEIPDVRIRQGYSTR
jgi:hypothetical protein